MKELTNARRVKAAAKAYRAYRKALGGGGHTPLPDHPEDFADMIGDLMSDSLHLAVSLGISPKRVDLAKLPARARDHFEYERLEESDPEGAASLFNGTPPGQRMVFPA